MRWAGGGGAVSDLVHCKQQGKWDFILDSAEVLMCSDPRQKRRMVWLIGLSAALRFYRRGDVTFWMLDRKGRLGAGVSWDFGVKTRFYCLFVF